MVSAADTHHRALDTIPLRGCQRVHMTISMEWYGMNIIGLDALVFGVDDISACSAFLCDYGLAPDGVDNNGGRFEALDGTAIIIRRADDPALPPAIGPAPSIRETVYGVASAADLDAIGHELSRDRTVTWDSEGALHSVDDSGFAIAFQVSVRRDFSAAPDQSARNLSRDAGCAAHLVPCCVLRA